MVGLTIEDIKKMKEEKRGFTQTIDLIVNVAGLDVKKPENRIREMIKLPHKVREASICLIVDALFGAAKQTNYKVLSKNDLDLKPREAKSLARDYDFFVIETPLMPSAAKTLGKFIGPRNKQMVPIPPTTKDIMAFTESLNSSVQINITKSPLIQIPIGKTNLKEEQILENYNYAIDKIKGKLETKKAQIKSVYVKTTMGKPIRVM